MSIEATKEHSDSISVVQALTVVPRVSEAQWSAASGLVRWLIVSRASVLVMTFSSVALGGMLALLSDTFEVTLWSLCLIGSLLAHATNNQLNDLTDSLRGIDAGNYFRTQYGTHALEDGLLDRNGLISYIAATGGATLVTGLLIAWLVGPVVLAPMAVGALLLVLYTYPLKQLGLGEIAVLSVWGPLIPGATYLVTTGAWSWEVALIATLYGLGPTCVVFGKHIDKIDFDRTRHMRTLPVRLGSPLSRYTVVAMTALQYLGVLWLVTSGRLPWAVLVVLFALAPALRLLRVYSHEAPATCPEGYPRSAWPLWYSAAAFVHTRNFGLLFLLGLLAASLGVR